MKKKKKKNMNKKITINTNLPTIESKINKQNRNTLIETIWWLPHGRGLWGGRERGRD